MPEPDLQRVLSELSQERKLVAVTPNPVAKNAQELGLDELVSFVISTGSTFAASFATSNPTILSAVGPVAEKPAFFVRHFYQAVVDYRSASKKGELNGRTFNDFLKPEMRGALKTLWMDVAFHDSSYFVIAQTLMHASTASPALLSAFAFMAAIPAAAALETVAETVIHHGLKRLSARSGVEWENYLESRFVFPVDAGELQDDLSKHFGLGEELVSGYHDHYLEHRLLSLAERGSYARRRRVTGSKPRHSLEMVFTSTSKVSPDDAEHNYFITNKEKGLLELPEVFDHSQLPYILRKTISDRVAVEVSFRRKTRHDDELSVSVDVVDASSQKVTVVELKVYEDQEKLLDALHYLHSRYRVTSTTLPKNEILGLMKSI